MIGVLLTLGDVVLVRVQYDVGEDSVSLVGVLRLVYTG